MIGMVIKQALIGAGSGEVESALSYFHRWAIIHNYKPEDFLEFIRHGYCQHEDNPPIPESPAEIRWHHMSSFCEAMVRAGADDNLLNLSPNRIKESVILSKNSFRDSRAWCPACFQQDIDQGGIPYFRFAWDFTEVIACRRHWVFLETRCPRCNRIQKALPRKGRNLAHCLHCSEMLVSARACYRGYAATDTAGRIYDIYDWIEAISSGWQPDIDDLYKSLFRNLVINGTLIFAGHLPEKGAIFLSEAWKINNLASEAGHRNPIDFTELLRIASYVDIPLARILRGEIAPIQKSFEFTRYTREFLGETLRPLADRFGDNLHLQQSIMAMLLEPELPGPPCTAASKLGTTVKYLRAYHPYLYTQYLDRWNMQRKERSRAIQRKKAAAIVETTQSFLSPNPDVDMATVANKVAESRNIGSEDAVAFTRAALAAKPVKVEGKT